MQRRRGAGLCSDWFPSMMVFDLDCNWQEAPLWHLSDSSAPTLLLLQLKKILQEKTKLHYRFSWSCVTLTVSEDCRVVENSNLSNLIKLWGGGFLSWPWVMWENRAAASSSASLSTRLLSWWPQFDSRYASEFALYCFLNCNSPK